MNTNNKKPAVPQSTGAKIVETKSAPPGGKPAETVPAGAPPRLFRGIDWLTFAITTLLVFVGYMWTLAPDVTLQDSGELAVASMYAGVPHPPGYPVWTIYTWFFTKIIPFGNMAWRVGISSAVAAALACGMIGILVSRGSSMMIEGIELLKGLDRKLENLLCVVAGFVAGTIMGYNGFMWSQAVIVEVYPLSVVSLAAVLLCLMRWIYAPQQRRYLYFAMFWFGICFNNHQSLLVCALSIELAVVVVQPKLGRDLLFWNVVIWAAGLFGKSIGMVSVLQDNGPLLFIYNAIGVVSAALWIWLLVKTKKSMLDLARDGAMVLTVGYLGVLVGHITSFLTVFYYAGDLNSIKTGWFLLFNLIGLGCVGLFVYLIALTKREGKEWISGLYCGGAWAIGAACYLYMTIASMSNPPLNWGYPRTVQGFFHALTRGQYERIHPSTEAGTFMHQIWFYIIGAVDEFNLVYLLIALIPIFFYRFMQKRERAWWITVGSFYGMLSLFLLILLNPAPDRQSQDLNKVFFTASHVMISMSVGYAITLVGGLFALQFEKFKQYARIASIAALVIAAIGLWATYAELPVPFVDPTLNPLVHKTALFGVILAAAAAAIVWLTTPSKGRTVAIGLLAVSALMPVYSIMSHWEENEQRGHWYGYWFGHDMFTPPYGIYPEMDRDTVLFGGTDPGRFNPTYMIFDESFIADKDKPKEDPKFDRRDVYLITQNALADGTYLDYIRAQYNRSAQIDPPFFSEFLRGPKERELNYKTNILARMVSPLDTFFLGLGDRIEKQRRAGSSYFKEKDFKDLPGFVAKLRSPQDPVSKYVAQNLSKKTMELMEKDAKANSTRQALAEDLNRLLESDTPVAKQLVGKLPEIAALDQKLSGTVTNAEELTKLQGQKKQLENDIAQLNSKLFWSPERFKGVKIKDTTLAFVKQIPESHTRIRLNRLLLEEAYPAEIEKSLGGVYPDREIITPTPEDSQKCFQEYLTDAQRRLAHDNDPSKRNEPRQLKAGEDVRVVDNKVQVSGQTAVMAINGLLTKIIFDKNPDHEFYVEESFPLDWMYPHLSPSGIIMKINRQPITDMTDEMVQKDHEFWSKFSDRLIGNWITYDTKISEICDFAEKVYHRRDYTGFKGAPQFIRDNDAQKAFSKLRSSIAGVYAWRLQHPLGGMVPQNLTQQDQQRIQAEQQRMLKEAEFSFKQAFAFCPYSPEAVFRYINLLVGMGPGRIDDAIRIAQTAGELDPNNSQLKGLVEELIKIKGNMLQQQPPPAPAAAPRG